MVRMLKKGRKVVVLVFCFFVLVIIASSYQNCKIEGCPEDFRCMADGECTSLSVKEYCQSHGFPYGDNLLKKDCSQELNSERKNLCQQCQGNYRYNRDIIDIRGIIYSIAAGIAILLLVINGYQLLTSPDLGARENAKRAIIFVILGLIVLLVGGAVMEFVFLETPSVVIPIPSATSTSSTTTSTMLITTTTTTSTTLPGTICVTLVENGDPADKLDIVFVGDDYSDSEIELFVSKVQEHANELLNTEPYNFYRNRINVHYVDKFEELGCYLFGDRLILCDPPSVISLASECPNDAIVVLFKSEKWAGAGSEKDKEESNYCVASHKYSWLTVHECGGHHIGGLMDEYLYEPPSTGSLYFSGANCDTSSSCPKWSGTPETGCYKDCSYTNLYRPSEDNCIMKKKDYPTFCPVCQKQIIKVLEDYS